MAKQKFVDAPVVTEIKQQLATVSQQTAASWAADCAEHILAYYAHSHPQDERPRQALAAARAWVRGQLSVSQARQAAFTAHEAARDAEDPAAIAAARAVGQAVATAHMHGHAIHASTYAVKSVAYATNFDARAIANERAWQYELLLNLAGGV